MASQILPFTVTIPPGTTAAAPFTQAINLDGWNVQAVDLEVPPGPNGLMGFQIYNNGVAWLPYGPDEWIVWNDHAERYPLDNQPNGSGWAVVGYNLGAYPHAVTTRWLVESAAQPAAQGPLPSVTINSTPPATEPVLLG